MGLIQSILGKAEFKNNANKFLEIDRVSISKHSKQTHKIESEVCSCRTKHN